MDNRSASGGVALELLVESVISRMFFIRPGIIGKFNPDRNTVDARVAIKVKKPAAGDKAEYEELCEIADIPLMIPYSQSAGLAITMPIRGGDPCLLLFSDRMLSLFWKTGGMALPEENGKNNRTTEPRQHEMQDAICIPGIITKNHILPEWNDECIELRDRNRKTIVSLGGNGIELREGEASIAIANGEITIKAPGGIAIDAPNFHIGGDGSGWVTSLFRARELETEAGFKANAHRHGGVEPGGGRTGGFI